MAILEAGPTFVAAPELLAKARETVHETLIPELLVIERPTFPDGRGFFRETFRKSELQAVLGRPLDFSQGNHARNEQQGVLRGLHIALWDKLIYVPRGRVQAVVADTRPDSPTFGRSFAIELGDVIDPGKPGEAKRASLLVPRGCANGYMVLSGQADYTYLVTEEWHPGSEQQVRWNDPDLGIKWNLQTEPILSERDQTAPLLQDLFPEKF